jgi:Hint domain
MGHSDPFAVVVLAFSPSDTTRTIYHVYSFEKLKMYARPIAQLLLGADDKRPNGCAPHERPTGLFETTGYPIGMVSDMTHLGGSILDELLAVYGVAIGPAEQKAKFAAIELANGDLLDGRIKILKGSVLEDQLSSLQWQPDEFGRLREPKGVANHCFVAGTMVMTEHGERPIESVRAGDMVWTRHGLYPVEWSGQTGIRQTVRARLSTGRDLIGTADHQVWTAAGWKDLSLLTHDDILTPWESTVRASWSHSGAKNTAGIRRARTSQWLVTSQPPTASFFTALSTLRYEDPSRRVFTFTTGTVTAPTTGSVISKPSTGENTSVRTCERPSDAQSPRATSSSLPYRPRASGTGATRGAHGTRHTQPGRSRSEISQFAYVGSAACPSSQSGVAPRCVPRSAAPRIDETAEQTTSHEHASSAGACSCATVTCARFGSVHTIAITHTGRSEVVHDLTIDGPPEFFANGVLVHNSADALIYARRLIAHMFDSGIVEPPKSGNAPPGMPPPAPVHRAEVPPEDTAAGPDWSYLFRR